MTAGRNRSKPVGRAAGYPSDGVPGLHSHARLPTMGEPVSLTSARPKAAYAHFLTDDPGVQPRPGSSFPGRAAPPVGMPRNPVFVERRLEDGPRLGLGAESGILPGSTTPAYSPGNEGLGAPVGVSPFALAGRVRWNVLVTRGLRTASTNPPQSRCCSKRSTTPTIVSGARLLCGLPPRGHAAPTDRRS